MRALFILMGKFELLLISREDFDLNEKSVVEWRGEHLYKSYNALHEVGEMDLYKEVYLKKDQYEFEGDWKDIISEFEEMKLLREIIK